MASKDLMARNKVHRNGKQTPSRMKRERKRENARKVKSNG